MYLSLPLGALVFPPEVTNRLNVPGLALPPVVAVISVGETTITFVAGIADGPAPCPCAISTDAPDTNPVPVIVIDVPPLTEPEAGLIPDTTGTL